MGQNVIERIAQEFNNIRVEMASSAGSVDPTFTGTVTLPTTTSIGVISSTELLALDGVTSNIQTQLGTKAPIESPTFTGTVTAPTFVGALTGNASTATKLATTRSITLSGDVTGTVNFDGSANVTISATIAANSVVLGTDTTGNYVASATAGTGITITGTAGEGWAPTITNSAPNVTTNLSYTTSATNGTVVCSDGTNAVIPAATATLAGLMVAVDKVKLDGSNNAGNLTTGTLPDARLTGSYTGLTNLTGTGIVDFSKFYGNAAGTVTAPSFSWTGDTNTGIYSPAADQLAITTGGVQRALFNSSGLTVTLLTETSDGRLKENVETLTDALSKVTMLRGVSYNLITTPEHNEIGLIAQEVETVVPELVITDDTEDGMKSVSYARTVALLIEAVKEQQVIIDDLNRRLVALEG